MKHFFFEMKNLNNSLVMCGNAVALVVAIVLGVLDDHAFVVGHLVAFDALYEFSAEKGIII